MNTIKTLLKHCVNCNKEFQVSWISTGSGSGNATRKKFCSKECKTQNQSKGKLIITCEVCEKQTLSWPSQNRKCCSSKCRQALIKKNRTEIIDCLTCSKAIAYSSSAHRRPKYCSKACFFQAISNRVEKFCEVCNKKFTMKKSKQIVRRFCSVICRRKGQSLGLVKSHVCGRSGFRLDIENSPYFKSSLEADYARYCHEMKIEYAYERDCFETIIDGKLRIYTPDFYHPATNSYVELKGLRPTESSSFANKINSNSNTREHLKKQGLNVIVIYMDEFYSMLKSSCLFDNIKNLEARNYATTKLLIQRR